MKQLKCISCEIQISTTGIVKLWQRDSALQNVVTEEELRQELAKPNPYVCCFHCAGENNLLVRADLFEELAPPADIETKSEPAQQEVYSGFS